MLARCRDGAATRELRDRVTALCIVSGNRDAASAGLMVPPLTGLPGLTELHLQAAHVISGHEWEQAALTGRRPLIDRRTLETAEAAVRRSAGGALLAEFRDLRERLLAAERVGPPPQRRR